MARSLATAVYTHEQIQAALKRPAVSYSYRVEVWDTTLSDRVGNLDGVTSANVTFDSKRAVHRGLTLSVDPAVDAGGVNASDLNGSYRVRPVVALSMPDRGLVDLPLGFFVWPLGKRRKILSGGVDEWRVTAGDLGFVLTQGGPGTSGFTAAADQRLGDVIANVITRAGFTDTTGIAYSSGTVSRNITWDLSSASGGSLSWYDVLVSLHRTAGFADPWFDADGRYRATPYPQITGGSTVSYTTAADSLIFPDLETGQDAADFCNRVIVRVQGANTVLVVDADDYRWWLPGAQGNLGYYVDKPITVAATQSTDVLLLAGLAALDAGLTVQDTVTWRTWFNPVHEMLELVQLTIVDDRDYNTPRLVLETGWSLDLETGVMTHTGKRAA